MQHTLWWPKFRYCRCGPLCAVDSSCCPASTRPTHNTHQEQEEPTEDDIDAEIAAAKLAAMGVSKSARLLGRSFAFRSKKALTPGVAATTAAADEGDEEEKEGGQQQNMQPEQQQQQQSLTVAAADTEQPAPKTP